MLTESNKIKYLIIAELDQCGFLLQFMDDCEEAKLYADIIFNASMNYPYSEMYIVEDELDYFASYTINGNELYIGNFIYGHSNGAYTVSVMKIDMDKFCLKVFIKERENHSTVFDYIENQEKFERILETFPDFGFYAN